MLKPALHVSKLFQTAPDWGYKVWIVFFPNNLSKKLTVKISLLSWHPFTSQTDLLPVRWQRGTWRITPRIVATSWKAVRSHWFRPPPVASEQLRSSFSFMWRYFHLSFLYVSSHSIIHVIHVSFFTISSCLLNSQNPNSDGISPWHHPPF